MQDKKFIFVCGLHRSGTSLLFDILGDHPKISRFKSTGAPHDEGQHLQTVFKPAHAHGGAGKFAFDIESHLDESSALVSPENASKLYSQWARHWDVSRPYLMEKSPPNLVRTRFLQALFPQSYFIFILRHPIAVSFATQKWTGTRLGDKKRLHARMGTLIEHWLVSHERYLKDEEHLERSRSIKYEELVDEPQAALDSLFAFLDLETIPADREVRSGVNDRYFTRWRNGLRSVWKSPYYNYLIARYEERVARFGYSLKNLT